MSAPAAVTPGSMTFNNNSAQDAEASNQAQIADNAQLQNYANNGSALAQSQLQGATNSNIKTSAGVIAGAKGINSGMAAREAGYNAANTNQVAANQSAALQAQTQMSALGQLSSNQMQQENLSLNQQNTQNALSAGIASNNTMQSQKFEGSVVNGVGSAVPMIGGMFKGMAATGTAGQADGGTGAEGGGGGGGGGGLGDMLAEGGSVEAPRAPSVNAPSIDPISAPKPPHVEMADYYAHLSNTSTSEPHSEVGKMAKNKMTLKDSFAHGGKANKKVPAMVSPGEVYLKPGQAKAVAKGKADPIKAGEKIPGTPKVAGNSYANDVVSKKLDVGGVVIPNSVMQSSDPAHNAYKFVQAVLAQKKAKGKR